MRTMDSLTENSTASSDEDLQDSSSRSSIGNDKQANNINITGTVSETGNANTLASGLKPNRDRQT